MNFVTATVYWPFLHRQDCLVKYHGKDVDIAVSCYLTHLIPEIVCVANTILTNSKLSTKFIPFIVYIGVIYGTNNFYSTKKSGKPVYPFLTWEGVDSLLIVLGMIVGFIVLWFALVQIDALLKHNSLTKMLERRKKRMAKK